MTNRCKESMNMMMIIMPLMNNFNFNNKAVVTTLLQQNNSSNNTSIASVDYSILLHVVIQINIMEVSNSHPTITTITIQTIPFANNDEEHPLIIPFYPPPLIIIDPEDILSLQAPPQIVIVHNIPLTLWTLE